MRRLVPAPFAFHHMLPVPACIRYICRSTHPPQLKVPYSEKAHKAKYLFLEKTDALVDARENKNLTICRTTIFVQGRGKRNNKSSLSLSVCGSSIHLNYYFDSIIMSV